MPSLGLGDIVHENRQSQRSLPCGHAVHRLPQTLAQHGRGLGNRSAGFQQFIDMIESLQCVTVHVVAMTRALSHSPTPLPGKLRK